MIVDRIGINSPRPDAVYLSPSSGVRNLFLDQRPKGLETRLRGGRTILMPVEAWRMIRADPPDLFQKSDHASMLAGGRVGRVRLFDDRPSIKLEIGDVDHVWSLKSEPRSQEDFPGLTKEPFIMEDLRNLFGVEPTFDSQFAYGVNLSHVSLWFGPLGGVGWHWSQHVFDETLSIENRPVKGNLVDAVMDASRHVKRSMQEDLQRLPLERGIHE